MFPRTTCLLRPTAIAAVLGLGVSIHLQAQSIPSMGQALTPFELRLGGKPFVPAAAGVDWDALRATAAGSGPAIVVVQLHSIPTLETRSALASAGLELGQPLSGNAYSVRLSGPVDRSAKALAAVRWAGLYPAEAKLSPALDDERASAYARRKAGQVELIVSLWSGADAELIKSQVASAGGTTVADVRRAGVLAVSVPQGKERALAALHTVRHIEPTMPPGSNESERSRGFLGVDVGSIPAGRPDGTGVRVGVIEGGHAQTTHPDFGNRVTQGDTGTLGFFGHTTMTMGTILSSGARSVAAGAATPNQWRGLAPNATGLTYSFLTNLNNTIADYIGDVTEAVQNDNIHVINNSWGDAGCHNIAYGAYQGRVPFLDGVVKGSLGRPLPIVFSGGNDRAGFFNSAANANDTTCITKTAAPFANYGTLNHPKSAKNLIVVGAVDSANNAMSNYSSWGPTQDGRLKPDVVAAGHHNGAATSGVTRINNPFGNSQGDVVGSASQQAYRTSFFDTTPPPNNFIEGWFSQTSAAAAQVTGGIALMIDAWRRVFPGRADPLPSTLRAALAHNAADLNDPSAAWYTAGPDYASGYGVVRINDTVVSLERGDAVEGSVAHSTSIRYSVNAAANSGPLRITLAWDDEPATAGASPALINDLDLVVTAPNGTRFFPWTLDPANPAAAAVRTVENHIDNMEQVLVDAPVSGLWTVVVRGTQVPSGRQNFSLLTRNGFTRQPSDLILALDTSDSMNSPTRSGGAQKIDVLRRSVQLLLQTWNLHAIAQDRIGFSAFNSNVTTTPNTFPALQPLQANLTALNTAAGNLTASGCTALGAGLQTALSSFDANSPNKRSILVVTDGMQSANPFVGEAGNPARLQIAQFQRGAALPFGAFFCTTTAANGPNGQPVLPDGIPVADHNTDIHAIGVGVNGAGFQQLLERLTSENRGLQHFTTTPDADLDLLYINDLVRALKSNTLEVIKTDSGTLSNAASRNLRFPVNGTVNSVTVVLSWQAALQPNAVSVQMRLANGQRMAPAQQRQGAFYTVQRYDLNAQATAGDWMLTLERSGSAVPFQLTLIADEGCFHYEPVYPKGRARAGDALRLGLNLSAAGQALATPPAVQALLQAPGVASGNLLAQFVPKTRAARAYLTALKSPKAKEKGASEKGVLLPSAAAALDAALRELATNPAYLKAARSKPLKPLELAELPLPKGLNTVLLGHNQLATSTPHLGVAGAYSVNWQINGPTTCGPVQRQELGGFVVDLGKIDWTASRIQWTTGLRGSVQISFKPVDGLGNLVGPGMAHQLKLEATGVEPLGELIDLLDGSYMRSFKTAAKQGKPHVRLTVGEQSHEAKP